MSYQVLARKWRPQTFAEMSGQAHVLKALSNALEQGRLHHAYLLSGTRGVGKTTIARILARCLNCEEGTSAQPCGVCPSCLEIAEGRSLDLIEVDAASRTKVEDTRELLDNVQFAPTNSRYKIYLIDEVHMLSNSSFNALLKTLEEPPPHVVFILATTHPQKIPATVLSRCLQFHLKSLPVDVIAERLQHIFAAEDIKAESAGVLAIARAAAGSMRDALSLADQAVAFAGGSVDQASVDAMLGTVDQQLLSDLLGLLVDGNAPAMLERIADYAVQVPDFYSLVDQLLELLHCTAVEQIAPGSQADADRFAAAVQDFARRLPPEQLQLYYQLLLVDKRDLPLAPDPLTGFEMLMLRLLAFGIDDTVGSTTDAELERPAAAAPEAAPQALKKNTNQPVTAHVDAPLPVPAAPGEQRPVAEQAASLPEPAATAFELDALDAQSWPAVYASVPLNGVVRTLASHCVPIEIASDPARVEFAMLDINSALYSDNYDERLAGGLTIVYGRPVQAKIRLVSSWSDVGLADGVETPALQKKRLQSERHAEAMESLSSDQHVNAILEAFDGSLDESTVRPNDIEASA